MMNRLHIRRLRLEDVSEVMNIAAATPAAPQWPASVYESAVTVQPEPPARIGWVATLEPGNFAGFVIVSLVPPEAEIESIAVASNWQRRGIGGTLLNAAFAELACRDVREVFLEVRESNQPAQALYESEGFLPAGRRRAYYHGPVEDALIYRRSL